ncbi:MAG: glycosyltransferase family 2 protein, partial [Ilumatobacteraceae bacterium]
MSIPFGSPAERRRPSVRAVVVNYCGDGVTERCIEALLADDLSAVDLEVVLVDNSPSDGVCERIRSAWPQVEVRSTGRN